MTIDFMNIYFTFSYYTDSPFISGKFHFSFIFSILICSNLHFLLRFFFFETQIVTYKTCWWPTLPKDFKIKMFSVFFYIFYWHLFIYLVSSFYFFVFLHFLTELVAVFEQQLHEFVLVLYVFSCLSWSTLVKFCATKLYPELSIIFSIQWIMLI